jgi:hypothetical protein
MNSADYLKTVENRNLTAAVEDRSLVIRPIINAVTAYLDFKERWGERERERE